MGVALRQTFFSFVSEGVVFAVADWNQTMQIMFADEGKMAMDMQELEHLSNVFKDLTLPIVAQNWYKTHKSPTKLLGFEF